MKVELLKNPSNSIRVRDIPENTICIVTKWSERHGMIGEFIIRFGSIFQTLPNLFRYTSGESWHINDFKYDQVYEAEIVPKGTELKITV